MTNDEHSDEDLEPRQPVPDASSRHVAYDAALERAQAAFHDVRAALSGRPVLSTVGDLAALLALLPADLPLWLDDQVRTDRDRHPASGEKDTRVVVAEVIALESPPVAALSGGDGRDLHDLVPALQLGTRVLPSSSAAATAPEHTRAYYLHDRAAEALDDGEISTYLGLAARQLADIASNLDSEATQWIPPGHVTQELGAGAGTLRAVAAALTVLAPLAGAAINGDEDVDEDPIGAKSETDAADPARSAVADEAGQNLPEQLAEQLAALQRRNSNPARGTDVSIEGGPLDGRTEYNDGSAWAGDDWYPEVDGVEHHYRLESLRDGSALVWVYKGL